MKKKAPCNYRGLFKFGGSGVRLTAVQSNLTQY